MSYILPKLSKEQEEKFIKDLKKDLKDSDEKESKVVDKIKISDIKEYLNKNIKKQSVIIFDESEKDYSEPRNKTKDINFYGEILESQIAKYFKLSELLEWVGFMEYKSHVPYDDFIEEGHNIKGDVVLFTVWFVPLLINDKKTILSQISDQGESYYCIETIEHILKEYPDSGFNYVNKYYSLNEILK